ncbi:adenylate/guanylate cyclase domain-containing protein [Gemmatimonadota bacterium]
MGGDPKTPGVARLVLTVGEDHKVHDLAEVNTLGRHPSNTIPVPDPVVSKRHAEIKKLPDGSYQLKDLGSLNGTFIRGRPVTEHVLEDGDEIQMGGARLLYVGGDEAEEESQKVTLDSDRTQSQIKERVRAEQAGDFLPAAEITDEGTLRRDYERLRISHELSQAVATELDLRRLLPKILEKAFELLPADRAVILLTDHMGNLVPSFARSRQGDSKEEIVLSNTVLEEVRNQKAAILSSDATMDSRFSGSQSVFIQGIRSTMTVPLLHRGELLGVMHLDTQVATNAFTEKDLQIFTGIAAEAAIAIQNARLATEIEREAETRSQLSRLISPAVVEQVVAGELTLERGGRLHEVTMLYSDIRGFTQMSEGSPPEEIMSTLNDHFELMVEVLFRHGGSLDKFVGDEIIGLFGAPVDLDDAPYKAVSCAIDMIRSLGEFNRLRTARGQKPVRVGIGINTGEVVTGAVGSRSSVQYTAIGDAMNVASRIVDLAKPDEVLVSEETFRRIRDRIAATPLPPARVKGKAEELKVYRVIQTGPGEGQ